MADARPNQATETRPGYLPQEVIDLAEAAGTWVPRDGRPVWVVCGDDREMDAASNKDFAARHREALSPAKGGLSIFGQIPAMAKHVAAVGTALQGEGFLRKVGGFDKLTDRLARSMAADAADERPNAVLPALHTSADKERYAFKETGGEKPKTTAAFCAQGDCPTGCAYCGNLGLASQLVGNDPDTQAVGRDNVQVIAGNDHGVDELFDAHRIVAEQLGDDYKYTRDKYVESGLPTMVLVGQPHAPVAKTGVLFNLNPEEIGKMGAFYRMDIAAAALAIRRALREYELPADLLMKSMILDAVPVRTVLAKGDESDKTPDPKRLAIGVRGGTMDQALTRIAAIEQAA